jgi:transketolase
MISDAKLMELSRTARMMRHLIVKMMGHGKPHHFGGSLSCVELVTALYFYKMQLNPNNSKWEGRDRFVMSKGHSVPAQYSALGLLGILPINLLPDLKKLGSILQGHPNSWMTPGIEACTGSLGQGLSFGNGMAIAARVKKLDCRIYVLMGDGELHEGQVWEAAMTTATRRLDHVVALIDRNQLKGQGPTEEAKCLEPLAEKWSAFGWHPITVDGHDFQQICNALDEADTIKGKPTVIIARTVKGRGVSFIEGRFEFHNASITQEQWNLAMHETEVKEATW